MPEVEPQPQTETRSLSIIAVDDDALVLMNTVIMLEDLGHTVVQAHSAANAIRLLEAGPIPDIVITDHAMPQMTGAELAQIIGTNYPGIVVIVASGYAELPSAADKAIRRLQKPFSQRQLEEIISSAKSGAAEQSSHFGW